MLLAAILMISFINQVSSEGDTKKDAVTEQQKLIVHLEDAKATIKDLRAQLDSAESSLAENNQTLQIKTTQLDECNKNFEDKSNDATSTRKELEALQKIVANLKEGKEKLDGYVRAANITIGDFGMVLLDKQRQLENINNSLNEEIATLVEENAKLQSLLDAAADKTGDTQPKKAADNADDTNPKKAADKTGDTQPKKEADKTGDTKPTKGSSKNSPNTLNFYLEVMGIAAAAVLLIVGIYYRKEIMGLIKTTCGNESKTPKNKPDAEYKRLDNVDDTMNVQERVREYIY